MRREVRCRDAVTPEALDMDVDEQGVKVLHGEVFILNTTADPVAVHSGLPVLCIAEDIRATVSVKPKSGHTGRGIRLGVYPRNAGPSVTVIHFANFRFQLPVAVVNG